jgi:hypothetical protein
MNEARTKTVLINALSNWMIVCTEEGSHEEADDAYALLCMLDPTYSEEED